MKRFLALAAFFLVTRLAAQSTTPDHFEDVHYLGGLTGYKTGHYGWLVLGDSALEFHECILAGCVKKDGEIIQPTAQVTMPYRKMTDVAGATERHGPSVGSKMLIGAFASERRDELVTVAFDSENSAEAPVFTTKEHESAQLLAKIRFKLRKMGLVPATPTKVRDSLPEPRP